MSTDTSATSEVKKPKLPTKKPATPLAAEEVADPAEKSKPKAALKDPVKDWSVQEGKDGWDALNEDQRRVLLEISQGKELSQGKATQAAAQTLTLRKIVNAKRDGFGKVVYTVTPVGTNILKAGRKPGEAAAGGKPAGAGPRPTPAAPRPTAAKPGPPAAAARAGAGAAVALPPKRILPQRPKDCPPVTTLELAEARLKIDEAQLEFQILDARRAYISQIAKEKVKRATEKRDEQLAKVQELRKTK